MVPKAERRTADVVIVGGGITGCSAAWFLARAGLEVLVLERDAIAAHASGAAAGMLTPIAEAEPGSPALAAGLASLAQLRSGLCDELARRSGVDPELERSGLLRVAHDARDAQLLHDRVDALREAGVAIEWLTPAEARTLQPGLAPDIAGASWAPEESHVRSPQLTAAYAGAARSLGARIVTGTAVTSLVVAGDRVTGVRASGAIEARVDAGCVVVCAGSWSGGLRSWLGAAGVELTVPPVEPVRGQILSLRETTPTLRTMVWDDGGYLVPKRDGSIVVGATEERAGFDARVTARGLAQLATTAPRIVPTLGDAAVERTWAGLRPTSPDGLPSIGPLDGVQQLFVAYGHHRSGVLLSAVTGQLVREHVAGKPPGRGRDSEYGFAPELFSPQRFER